MNEQKNLLVVLGEWWEQRRPRPRAAGTGRVPGRLLRWFLPNGGLLLLIIVLILTQQVWAKSRLSLDNALDPSATTGLLSYQGYLTDAGGAPLNSNVDIIFHLYDVPEGGAALWTEEHTEGNAVPVSNGLFNVLLGSLTPIPSGVWDNDTLYLGVQVGSDAEMTPREVVGAVPVAMTAENLAADAIPTGSNTWEGWSGEHSGAVVMVDNATYLSFPGTETTIQVSSSSRILVVVSASLKVVDGSGYLYTAICRDGTRLPAINYAGNAGFRNYDNRNLTYIDTVGAGTHTYTICAAGAAGLEVKWWRPIISLVAVPGQ